MTRERAPARGRRVRVADHSMEPTLRAGDRLIVDPNGFGPGGPRRGDLIVARDPEQPRRWLVKRVGATGPGRFWLFRDRLEPVGMAEPPEGPPPEGAVELVELPAGAIFLLSDRVTGTRDSRRFGPVLASAVVGRVTFRTAPPGRAGPL